MTITATDIATALKAKQNGPASWMACCPAHDDKTPSLSITDGDKGPLIHCHAGCTQDAVVSELKARGLWKNGSINGTATKLAGDAPQFKTRSAAPRSKTIPLAHPQLGPYVQHWDYHDIGGMHVMRICRWDTENGKEIRPLSLQGEYWEWKQLTHSRPLFRLPSLKDKPRARVLLVEGEKAADAGKTIVPGMVVTTWAGGANAVLKTDFQPLLNRDVTLLADNDQPGAMAMDTISAILGAHNCTVRRVDLTTLGALPDGWDCADAMADKGFDLDKLWDVIEHAPIVQGRAHTLSLRSAADIVSTPIHAAWLLRPYLEQMVLALLFGELGTLKSFVTLDMLLHIAAGKAWAGSTFKPKPQAVIYVSAEGKGLAKRLQAWALHHGVDLQKIPFYAVEHALDLSNPAGILELVEAIEAMDVRPAVIGIDTLSRNCGPLDENSTADMGGFINALDLHLRQRLKCSVLLVHHTGHMEKGRARGSYSLMASTDAAYRVERPDPDTMTVKLSTGRLKDSESPPPLYLEARVINLGTTDEDGQPETSLVLLPTDERPAEPKRQPNGKQQSALLRLLEKEYLAGNTVWTLTEMARLAREQLEMGRSTSYNCATTLTGNGFLKQVIGGVTLSDPPAKSSNQ